MRPGLHPDEFDVDVGTVRRLVGAQFPEFAELPVREPVWGTVNTMFRLGDEHVARLLFTAGGAGHIRRETTWLPLLAYRLSARIPRVIGVGEQDAEYPSP